MHNRELRRGLTLEEKRSVWTEQGDRITGDSVLTEARTEGEGDRERERGRRDGERGWAKRGRERKRGRESTPDRETVEKESNRKRV